MKCVYICSPYSGDTERNIKYAKELTAQAIMDGYCPITPHLYIPLCLNDNEPRERKQGLEIALRLLEQCDLLIVGTRFKISKGMEVEIETAERLGIEVRYDID